MRTVLCHIVGYDIVSFKLLTKKRGYRDYDQNYMKTHLYQSIQRPSTLIE